MEVLFRDVLDRHMVVASEAEALETTSNAKPGAVSELMLTRTMTCGSQRVIKRQKACMPLE
jgi:hypothetical protein